MAVKFGSFVEFSQDLVNSVSGMIVPTVGRRGNLQQLIFKNAYETKYADFKVILNPVGN